jgi:predicted TPR repeat methyltransferase
MIEIAKEKTWNASVKNATFVQADVLDRATKDQVDVILAFNLLHLIEQLPEALKRVADQLQEDGLFISKTPCLADGKWYFRPMVSIMQFFGKAPYVGFLDVANLEREIELAGFTIIETGSYPAKPPSRYIVARRD